MSYPVLYESNATDFFNNGLGTLPDALTATVTEERNGEFVLDMTYPLHGIRANQIKNNRIIKVDAGHKLTDQRFVIKSVAPAMDTSGNTVITVHAEHVSYLANDLAIKPQVAMTDVNAEQALNMWNSSLTTPNQFTVDSDITTHNSTSWSIDKVQNARQALGGVEGSILDVWGGEYRFDNLHISLMSKRGTVSNTLLAYGRNITSFEQEQNIMDTYTSVYPYYVLSGEANEDSTIYTVPNLVVNSANANKFPNQKTMPLEVSSYLGDIKVGTKPADASADDKTEYITVQELQSRMTKIAQQYIKNNNIGVPKVSIKVSFVDLSKTANYADVAPLEQLDLCDEVPVRFPELDIDTTAKVSRVIWNVLTDSYDSLELGDISATLGDKISQVEQNINKTNNKIDEIHNYVQTGADGKSTVYRGPDTPTANHVGDLWYKPNGEDTDMYQWDGVTWVLVVSTKDTHEIRDAVDKAIKEMKDKEKEINGNLELQKIDISQAQADIEQARQDAANSIADIRSQVAKDMADAKAQSKQALDTANSVDDKATEALTNAEQAVNDAKEAQSTTATIKTDVDTVKGQLSSKADKTTVDDLTKTVSSNSTSITQNAKDIKTKANSSTVNTLAGKVTDAETSISQNATDIKSKADKSTVDTLNQTVKSQGTSITQNANAIKSKASSSDVDKLSGRVSTAETTLTQTANGLKGKADSSQLNKLSGDLTTLSNNFSTTSAGFNASLSKIDDKVNSNKEETDSALQVAKADIKATADNLSTNYTKTTDEHNYVNSQIKESADKINLSVASVSDKIDGMEIGGRNLLLDTINQRDTEYWYTINPNTNETDYFNGSNVHHVKNAWTNVRYYYENLVSRGLINYTDDFTFSMLVRTSDDVVIPSGEVIHFYSMESSLVETNVTTQLGSIVINGDSLSKEWQRIGITFKFVKPKVQSDNVTIRFEMSNTLTKGEVLFTQPMLVRGNKATDWTPAPEDTDSKIAALQIDADGIKQTVSNKADTSYVDQKANSLTTTIGRNKTDADNKINANKKDVDNQISQVKQTANSLSSTVANNKTATDKVINANKQSADTQFSNINQTIKGITSTVASKADISQIKQLDNQIQLVVTNANTEKVNLVLNGSFKNGDNWRGNSNVADTWYSVAGGVPIVSGHYGGLHGVGNANPSMMQSATHNVILAVKGKKVTLSAYARCEKNGGQFRPYIRTTASDGSYSYFGTGPTWYDLKTGWQRYSVTGTLPSDITAMNLNLQYTNVSDGLKCYFTGAMLTLGDQLFPYQDSTNDIVSQINVDESGVLIQGKKIMIDGDATIKNAVIKSSMIDTLDASKITAGTLNAANVNIINMNANNITTGTLKGANLSMNLNTGEVLFQKGSIKSTNGKLNISVDNGTMSVTNSNNEGIYFKDGKMMLSNSNPFNNQKIAYGLVSYETPWILNGGLTITGYQGALLTATNKKITASSFNNNHPWFRDSTGNIHFYGGFTDGSGVAVQEDDVVVGSGAGRVDISGGTLFTPSAQFGGLYEQAHIEVGTSAWNKDSGFNDSINVGKNIAMYAYGIDLATSYNIAAHTKKFVVFGDFSVSGGKKNAVVPTSQGDVAIDAYETAEYYFGDIGSLNTGEAGYAKVIIDSLFNETVNTSIPYHVFTTAYEDSYIWVTDRTPTSFIVHSSKPNVDVSYEIKAKRLGYEGDRLEIQEGV